MLKVISVVDKTGSAIDRLAKSQIPFMSNIDYEVIDVHPKRPDPEQLAHFEQSARLADVIAWDYFRTAEMLRERYPWAKEILSILTHYNPYSITESDWNSYQVVVGDNRTIYKALKEITQSRVEHIHLAVDPFFWQYNDNYKYERSVIMVANRIEAKKGILEVAEACKSIEAKMYLVGNISDMEYFKQVINTGVVNFSQNIPDEDLRSLYYDAGIHVCNSVDNFESGTMPIIEAMFCGVPVLTRKVGHIPDIYSDNNLVVGDYQPDDVQAISEHLEMMFADKKKLDELRNEGWFSVKHMNPERRAYMYQKLYREVLGGETVSVIMPVAGKDDVTQKSISAVLEQTHRNIELIVIDDGEVPQDQTIAKFYNTSSIPIRYIRTGGVGYNLAKARNLGIIEATGDVLIFCDQRIIMQPNAIEEFLKELKPKIWVYGSKGVKKDFIENFSCIYRQDIISMGLFNERITEYGGMSQEIRSRARLQSLNLKYLESAKAEAYGKSPNRWRKKYELMRMKNMLWKMNLR